MSGRFWTGFGIGIAVFSIALTIFLWLIGAFSPPELPKAHITALHFGDEEITDFQQNVKAPRILTVVGQSLDVPSEWTVWVCVFPLEAQHYYPQREPVSNNGIWQLEDVCLGSEEIAGASKTFIISLVVADVDATKQLYKYAQYIFTGMEQLPNGAVICDEVLASRSE